MICVHKMSYVHALLPSMQKVYTVWQYNRLLTGTVRQRRLPGNTASKTRRVSNFYYCSLACLHHVESPACPMDKQQGLLTPACCLQLQHTTLAACMSAAS
jgi:hypothetical protein